MNATNPNLIDYVGLGAADTVQRLILSFEDIAQVTLASYSHLPMVQERTHPSEPESAVVRNAVELRSALHLPFWDCVMLAISKAEAPMDTLLDTAGTHVSLRSSDIVLDREAILQGAIQESLVNRSLERRETCLISEVVMVDGSIRHLPMMDFHCQPTMAGRRAATAVCKRIFLSGALLLKSGESFHAYGLKLVSIPTFFEFLGRALLYSPIIDRAYIAHQLIEKRCALRISGVIKPDPMTIDLV